MRRVTRRQALISGAAGLGAAALAGCGGAARSPSGSTLASTWVDPTGDGQLTVARRVTPRRGERRSGPGPGRAAAATGEGDGAQTRHSRGQRLPSGDTTMSHAASPATTDSFTACRAVHATATAAASANPSTTAAMSSPVATSGSDA